jgi:hypothetical protein
MGITPKYSSAETLRELQRQYRSIERGILIRLDRVGLQWYTNAKTDLNIDTSAFPAIRKQQPGDKVRGPGEYLDDTGNLRSSIGYFVLKDGIVVSGKVEGESEGISAAKQLLGTIPIKDGYVLVGVAGVDYASYLESRGFNVITSQAQIALIDIEASLKRFAKAKNIEGFDVDMTGVSTAMR